MKRIILLQLLSFSFFCSLAVGQPRDLGATQVFRPTPIQVIQAQKILKARNLYVGESNGNLNEETRSSIRSYQREMGLAPTGTLNKATLEEMGIALTEQQRSVRVSLSSVRSTETETRAGVAWEPYVVMDNQLFPSFLITTATLELPRNFTSDPKLLGTGLSTVGIRIMAATDGTEIKLVTKMPGIAEPSTYIGSVPKGMFQYDLIPHMNYKYDVLSNLKQPITVNAAFTLYINGELVGEKSKPIRVRSVNDVPLGAVMSNGQYIDMPWMVAAYVNEDHPWIDQLLREAINTRAVNSFIGYQGTQQDVFLQVAAIWNVLQRRGFRYSNITTTSGTSRMVTSQHIRFFEDSIATSQANCLDGSVLFASILRKIGIDPIVVLIPGHAFVGFYLDNTRRTSAFLETTMMGNVNLANYNHDYALGALMRDLFGVQTKNQVSFKSFLEAYNEGNRKYNANVYNFSRNVNGFRLVDIASVRKIGIMPISH